VLAKLTSRERQILSLVAHGMSNTEIAEELSVGPATVKTHVGSVLTKLRLRDRVQAVVFAYEHAVVEPGRGAPGEPAQWRGSRVRWPAQRKA